MDIEKFIKGFNTQINKNGFKYRDFANSCCFHFAHMLKGAFPNSRILYDVKGHYVIRYNDKLYDMEGEYFTKNTLVPLDVIKEDPLWYGRVLEGNAYKTV